MSESRSDIEKFDAPDDSYTLPDVAEPEPIISDITTSFALVMSGNASLTIFSPTLALW